MKRFISWLARRFGVADSHMDRALMLREKVDPERLMLNPDGSIGLQGQVQLDRLRMIVDSAYSYRETNPKATGEDFAYWWFKYE